METLLTILYWYLGLGVITMIIAAIVAVKSADKDMTPLTGEDLGMIFCCGLIWPVIIVMGLKELFKEELIIYDPKAKAKKREEKELLEGKRKSQEFEDQLDVIKEETKEVPWYKR